MKKIVFLIMCLSNIIIAQTKTISGVVVDDSNLPLSGVSVLIKGTTTGTSTDYDGKYSINAQKGDILVYSFIGYMQQEISVGKSKTINVNMIIDSQLDEVVVTAMGIKREKKALGYAVSSIPGSTSRVKIHSNYNEYQINAETYKHHNENDFKSVTVSPLSTFSVDVDNASYSNVRRMINNGLKVDEDAVKIEEFLNYFDYSYPQPSNQHPFSITTELSNTPWNAKSKLIRIGLQGKTIDKSKLPPSNLVFLIDVSGSMGVPNKLGLLKQSFKYLVKQLRDQDKVSIVVYAGAAGLVLEPTSGVNKDKITNALDKLTAGGSTAGGAGINLAYKIAQENFIKGGNNRVILATDGDFNVGASSDSSMQKLIEEKRKSGVFLTCLGFGYGNYKDSKLETLANKGNGNHAYIDNIQESNRIFGKEFGGTLFTIAKDVKIQVEFNPELVAEYRLIGYENRLLNAEDFVDDKKDAGELGSGHNVTALYEVVLKSKETKGNSKDIKLKYSHVKPKSDYKDEVLTVKFRYKKPDGNKSIEMVETLKMGDKFFNEVDFKFSSAVALFGQKLKNSNHIKQATYKDIITLAESGRGTDKDGYRAEFIRLVKTFL